MLFNVLLSPKVCFGFWTCLKDWNSDLITHLCRCLWTLQQTLKKSFSSSSSEAPHPPAFSVCWMNFSDRSWLTWSVTVVVFFSTIFFYRLMIIMVNIIFFICNACTQNKNGLFLFGLENPFVENVALVLTFWTVRGVFVYKGKMKKGKMKALFVPLFKRVLRRLRAFLLAKNVDH